MNAASKTCLMLLDNAYDPDHRPRREIQTLRTAGWQVALLCEHAEGLPHSECQDGVEIRRIDPPWRARPFSPRSAEATARTLDAVRKAWPAGFDVVHCHDWLTLPFGRQLARALGARLVYDSHEYFAGAARGGRQDLRARMRYRIRLWREAWALRHVDLLVTVSPTIARWFFERRKFRNPVLVLNNMPDWQACSRPDTGLRARLGVPQDALLLVHGGNIRFQTRRVDIVVDALARVDDCHLLCVGTGEDGRLKEMARARGVADRVHHLPAVPYGQLGDVLAACDIGLSILQPGVPNHEAALPNKLFEYLAAGIPVLGSPLEQQRSYLEDQGVGWTMAALSADACADALRSARSQLQAVKTRVAGQRERYVWNSQDAAFVSAYAALAR